MPLACLVYVVLASRVTFNSVLYDIETYRH